MCTEAGAEKTSLDCHISYVNLQFQAYVEDCNSMTSKPQVFESLTVNERTVKSSAYLVSMRWINFSAFPDRNLKFKKIGVWERHGVEWNDDAETALLQKFGGLLIKKKFKQIALETKHLGEFDVFMDREFTSTKVSLNCTTRGFRGSSQTWQHFVIERALQSVPISLQSLSSSSENESYDSLAYKLSNALGKSNEFTLDGL